MRQRHGWVVDANPKSTTVEIRLKAEDCGPAKQLMNRWPADLGNRQLRHERVQEKMHTARRRQLRVF